MKRLAWWARQPVFVAVCMLAAAGALGFGVIPGWGPLAAAASTLIGCAIGFEAGVKYQRQTGTD